MKLVSIYDEAESVQILYRLLSERTPDQSISHKGMPHFEDHYDFVHSKPYNAWYLIKYKGDYVGSIYLTKLRELGIFIFNEYQHRGIATKAIHLIQTLHPGRMLANVNPNNTPSMEMFKKMGNLIQVTFTLDS